MRTPILARYSRERMELNKIVANNSKEKKKHSSKSHGKLYSLGKKGDRQNLSCAQGRHLDKTYCTSHAWMSEHGAF